MNFILGLESVDRQLIPDFDSFNARRGFTAAMSTGADGTALECVGVASDDQGFSGFAFGDFADIECDCVFHGCANTGFFRRNGLNFGDLTRGDDNGLFFEFFLRQWRHFRENRRNEE